MKRPRAPIACFRCHHKKVRMITNRTLPKLTLIILTLQRCAVMELTRSVLAAKAQARHARTQVLVDLAIPSLTMLTPILTTSLN
jgi:hypothetical protein